MYLSILARLARKRRERSPSKRESVEPEIKVAKKNGDKVTSDSKKLADEIPKAPSVELESTEASSAKVSQQQKASSGQGSLEAQPRKKSESDSPASSSQSDGKPEADKKSPQKPSIAKPGLLSGSFRQAAEFRNSKKEKEEQNLFNANIIAKPKTITFKFTGKVESLLPSAKPLEDPENDTTLFSSSPKDTTEVKGPGNATKLLSSEKSLNEKPHSADKKAPSETKDHKLIPKKPVSEQAVGSEKSSSKETDSNGSNNEKSSKADSISVSPSLSSGQSNEKSTTSISTLQPTITPTKPTSMSQPQPPVYQASIRPPIPTPFAASVTQKSATAAYSGVKACSSEIVGPPPFVLSAQPKLDVPILTTSKPPSSFPTNYATAPPRPPFPHYNTLVPPPMFSTLPGHSTSAPPPFAQMVPPPLPPGPSGNSHMSKKLPSTANITSSISKTAAVSNYNHVTPPVVSTSPSVANYNYSHNAPHAGNYKHGPPPVGVPPVTSPYPQQNQMIVPQNPPGSSPYHSQLFRFLCHLKEEFVKSNVGLQKPFSDYEKTIGLYLNLQPWRKIALNDETLTFFHFDIIFDSKLNIFKIQTSNKDMSKIHSDVKAVLTQVQELLQSTKLLFLCSTPGDLVSLSVRRCKENEIMAIFSVRTKPQNKSQIQRLKEELKRFAGESILTRQAMHSLFICLIDPVGFKTYEHIWGKSALTQNLLEIPLRVLPGSKVPVNSPAAEACVKALSSILKIHKKCLLADICCRSGYLGLSLAEKCGQVIGIDSDQTRMSDAQLNCINSNVRNASYTQGSIENNLKEILSHSSFKEVYCVIDPPKQGLSTAAVNVIRTVGDIRKIAILLEDTTDPTFVVDLARAESKNIPGEPFVPISVIPIEGSPNNTSFTIICLLIRISDEEELKINLDDAKAKMDLKTNGQVPQGAGSVPQIISPSRAPPAPTTVHQMNHTNVSPIPSMRGLPPIRGPPPNLPFTQGVTNQSTQQYLRSPSPSTQSPQYGSQLLRGSPSAQPPPRAPQFHPRGPIPGQMHGPPPRQMRGPPPRQMSGLPPGQMHAPSPGHLQPPLPSQIRRAIPSQDQIRTPLSSQTGVSQAYSVTPSSAQTQTKPQSSSQGQIRPQMPTQGQSRPQMPMQGQSRPQISSQGQSRPQMSTQGQSRPQMPMQGQSRPQMSSQGQSRPQMPSQGQNRPQISPQGQTRPQMPTQDQSRSQMSPQSQTRPQMLTQGQSRPQMSSQSPTRPTQGDPKMSLGPQTPSQFQPKVSSPQSRMPFQMQSKDSSGQRGMSSPAQLRASSPKQMQQRDALTSQSQPRMPQGQPRFSPRTGAQYQFSPHGKDGPPPFPRPGQFRHPQGSSLRGFSPGSLGGLGRPPFRPRARGPPPPHSR